MLKRWTRNKSWIMSFVAWNDEKIPRCSRKYAFPSPSSFFITMDKDFQMQRLSLAFFYYITMEFLWISFETSSRSRRFPWVIGRKLSFKQKKFMKSFVGLDVCRGVSLSGPDMTLIWHWSDGIFCPDIEPWSRNDLKEHRKCFLKANASIGIGSCRRCLNGADAALKQVQRR